MKYIPVPQSTVSIKKIIGIYVMVFSASGIVFIVSLAWMILNLSDIKVGERFLLGYIFSLNIYLLLSLLLVGVLGGIGLMINRYIDKNNI